MEDLTHCPQLLLNSMQDFNKIWWIIRCQNKDVHVEMNSIFDIFRACLDFLPLIFHPYIGGNALSTTPSKLLAGFDQTLLIVRLYY